MKNIIFKLLLIFSLILCVSSCNSENNGPQMKYNTGDLQDGSYALMYGENVIYPYDNKIFAATGSKAEEHRFGYYDLSNGMAYTNVAELPADGLCADENGIYIVSGGDLLLLSADGEVTDEITLSDESADENEYCMCLTGDYFYITEISGGAAVKELKFYTVNRSDSSAEVKIFTVVVRPDPDFQYRRKRRQESDSDVRV